MSESESINNIETTPAKRPAGRPFGSRNRKTIFVEQLFHKNNTKQIKAICTKVLKMAEGGDLDACKLVLQQISPPRKGALTSFPMQPINSQADVVEAINGLLMAVATSKLSTAEAAELSGIIEKQSKALAEKRILELADAGTVAE